jgi:hypothetical protein
MHGFPKAKSGGSSPSRITKINKVFMNAKTFYRVANVTTNQGLWYNIDGEFTGLIHKKYSFCRSNVLPMPFDENLNGSQKKILSS